MPDRVVLWHRRVPSSRDDQEDAEFLVSWTRKVVTALAAARASAVAAAGTSVAAELDPIDFGEAIDAILRLLTEAERLEPPLKICFGAAFGDINEVDDGTGRSFRAGAALDRAQLLANRARAGELVLDPTARELAGAAYLFGRQVAASAGSLKGHAIDRRYPRRSDCRPAIEKLGVPIIPRDVREMLRRIDELARSRGQHRIILRGPIGAGASEWIDALARAHSPPLALRLEAVPGALEPLGSLRYALLRRWKTQDGIVAAVSALDGDAPETLAKIARGAAVERDAAVRALHGLLDYHGGEGQRPWVIADPLNAIDPATVGVLADATLGDTPAVLLIARLPLDARPPKPLQSKGGLEEIILPVLRTADGKEIAAAILGPTTPEDVTRRVAVLGGDTPLGVVEAARTLIAAGDLVHQDGAFRFRVGPRRGVSGIPVEALLEERLAAVESVPRRILEAVCAAPSGSPSDLARFVVAADGLGLDEIADGIDRLCTEALLELEEPLAATSTMLRAVVVQAMPPARLGELYRFIAKEMQAGAAKDGEFEKATIGYYLAEGGREADGARALIEAGRAAALHGFPRAAVRLAAAAVQFDTSKQTRAAATMLSRSVSGTADRDSSPPLPVTVVADHAKKPEPKPVDATLTGRALAAFRGRDFDAVDRLLDIAVAEGHDHGAAFRLRAVSLLARGDLAGARTALARARAADRPNGGSGARTELAHALVLLVAGRAPDAVHASLRALAHARKKKALSGEAAALQTLALCYRALGRDDAARRFEDASPA